LEIVLLIKLGNQFEHNEDNLIDDPEEIRRFVIELEFIQCFANPHYLNFLAIQGYFADQAFIRYLNYLQYWLQSKYVKYVKYSQCLHFLRLLQDPDFRLNIANPANADNILSQQDSFWLTYWKNRMDSTIPEFDFV
jgi:mediator of RNA polymerase II transcription subunit 31